MLRKRFEPVVDLWNCLLIIFIIITVIGFLMIYTDIFPIEYFGIGYLCMVGGIIAIALLIIRLLIIKL